MILNEENIDFNDLSNITNKLICGETLDVLKKMPSDSVNTIITSPSYFLGKDYEKDYNFNNYIQEHRLIISECNRVLKNDGAIFWNVAQTVMDKEIYPLGAIFYNIFKELNYYLKNWIIWKFQGGECPRTRLFGRYENILWFVKNNKHYKFNVDDIRIPSKWITDKRCNPKGKNPEDFWEFDKRSNRNKISELLTRIKKLRKLLSIEAENYVNQIKMDELIRDLEIELDDMINAENDIIQKNLSNNIWHINRVVNINKKEKIKHPKTGEKHPCPFPEEMISRIIKMSTDKNDIVLDIFNGSGTVCKVAHELERRWIGIDKEMRYCEIAKERLSN